ncbi:MAG: hypothetical protein MK135_15120, partial [Polyangiaceae bacterium]|nr:hypothetical protein [Polyangiaceae bacterium]
RTAVQAAMVDPHAKAYEEARGNVVQWMQVALTSGVLERAPRTHAERDEAMDAYQAIRSGAPSLVALALRQEDALDALQTLEQAQLERALPPKLSSSLRKAIEENDQDSWQTLFRIFESMYADASGEHGVSPELSEAASFAISRQLYKNQPTQLESALPLAMLLSRLGMPEVASGILSAAALPSSSRQAVAWSLGMIMQGLVSLSDSDQLEAARSSLQAAQPILELATAEAFDEIRPAPEQAYALLASLEIRAGNADRALPLLLKAASRQPTINTRLRIAQLLDQKGDSPKAGEYLQLALKQAQAQGDALLEAQVFEKQFLLYRHLDEQSQAKEALHHALDRALVAQEMDLSLHQQAQLELNLARILSYFDAEPQARRFFDRSLSSSETANDAEVALTEMSRVGLTRGDLTLARRATREGLNRDIPPEHLIYIALWQKLAEAQAGARADGLSHQVFSQASGAKGWQGQLVKFGLGEITSEELLAAAGNIVEKTEAEFYTAVSEKEPNRATLAKVAQSPAIDLLEVKIARDLLQQAKNLPALPKDLELP